MRKVIFSIPLINFLLCSCNIKSPKYNIEKLAEKISLSDSVKNKKPDNYAVLMSSNTRLRHKKNLSLAYQVLLENGFKKEHVYILDNMGKETSFYPVNGPTLEESIKMVFDHLSKIVDKKDFLFLYITGHGKLRKEKIKINGAKNTITNSTLYGDVLKDFELENYLSEIKPKLGLLVFDQCYGGGFAKKTGKGNYIAISASTKDEESKDNTFPQAFFSAWRNKNIDKKISAQEAYEYALAHDRNAIKKRQHPQIVYEKDPSSVFLGMRN